MSANKAVPNQDWLQNFQYLILEILLFVLAEVASTHLNLFTKDSGHRRSDQMSRFLFKERSHGAFGLKKVMVYLDSFLVFLFVILLLSVNNLKKT